MIIVHDNKEILTHNSRRFLVVCNFPSETYTFMPEVEVPPRLLKRKKVVGHEVESLPRMPKIPPPRSSTEDPGILINIADKYKFNSLRDSRFLTALTGHRVMQKRTTRSSETSHDSTRIDNTFVVSLSVLGCMIVLMIGSLIYCLTNKTVREEERDEEHSHHQRTKGSNSSLSSSATPSSPSTSSRKSLFVV